MRNGKQLKRYTSSEAGFYSTVIYHALGANRLAYYQALSYISFSLIRIAPLETITYEIKGSDYIF
jgi:hypothetical protein